jgi:large subunit ribosomal protein L15
MTPVNLDRVQEAIDEGRLNPDIPITMKTLKDARVVNKIEDGVKLLARVARPSIRYLWVQGKDMLKQPIQIYASRASKEAIQTIESAGGRFTAVYYNKLGLQYLVNPDNFGISKRKPRPAMPVKRYLIGIPFL